MSLRIVRIISVGTMDTPIEMVTWMNGIWRRTIGLRGLGINLRCGVCIDGHSRDG